METKWFHVRGQRCSTCELPLAVAYPNVDLVCSCRVRSQEVGNRYVGDAIGVEISNGLVDEVIWTADLNGRLRLKALAVAVGSSVEHHGRVAGDVKNPDRKVENAVAVNICHRRRLGRIADGDLFGVWQEASITFPQQNPRSALPARRDRECRRR